MLAKGGRVAAINGGALDWIRKGVAAATGLPAQRPHYDLVLCNASQPAELERLAGWVAAGKLRVNVEAELPLSAEGVREGYDKLAGRRVKGKVVVAVVPPAAAQ